MHIENTRGKYRNLQKARSYKYETEEPQTLKHPTSCSYVSFSHWKKGGCEPYFGTSIHYDTVLLYPGEGNSKFFLTYFVFRVQFQVSPVLKSIKNWCAKFRESFLCTTPRPRRPVPSYKTVNRIREAYQRSFCKSTTSAILELRVAQSTVWRILSKRQKCKPYRLQMHHALSEIDKDVRLLYIIHSVYHLALCIDIFQRDKQKFSSN
jgi:hypothetical protein